MSLLTFVNNTQLKSDIATLETGVKDNPSKVIYVQAKDGKTPVKGIDYFDGKNGINSVSFSIETTIIKEVPLIGEKGADGKNGSDGLNGKDAPYQSIRINPDTGDLESKTSDQRGWDILVVCSELKVGCN